MSGNADSSTSSLRRTPPAELESPDPPDDTPPAGADPVADIEMQAPGLLEAVKEPSAAGGGREASSWQNFGKMLLVFSCIGTDFCKKIIKICVLKKKGKKICVLQHFSKSTRLSS